MKHIRTILLFSILAMNISLSQQSAELVVKENSISISYHGQLIVSGKLSESITPYKIHDQTKLIDNCTHQIITITADDFKTFELQGEITAGNESIPCESEPRDRGLKVVRHSVGQSKSLLNNAVYSRQADWLISFDATYPRMEMKPADNNKYKFTVKGWEIVIRFRPHYYKEHRKLPYFTPSERSERKKPIVGWCSWFAFYDKITEQDIKETADVLAAKLKPFGLEYLQIDDGYQQVPIGMPETWLEPNQKFPSGLQNLSDYIKSKGLRPGIWTNVSFADSAAAFDNKNLFVQDSTNTPALGNWVGYVMDGSNPQTLEMLINPIYKGLRNFGWQYFKLDALRHLKYEGYNTYSDYFSKKGIDRNDAFTNVVRSIRKQIGKENFLLACWGIRPELAGIVDGCRIGNDGYSYAGLAQFNSFNNIVWLNDPDHIELTDKEAYRSCTATSLTGSLFMLTDKPGKYETSPLIEAATRSIPVLYTQPCQMYDVDPSRSSRINLVDVEMSGSGPRSFDASTATTTGLFSLEINKSFEDWLLLGRLDNRDKIIPLIDLGLDDKKDYLVFEFWTKKYFGTVQKQLERIEDIDTTFGCQVFCFREKQNHPQLVATNRHITCGGTELINVMWGNNTISGISDLVAGDKYIIYVYEPVNYQFTKIEIDSNVILLKNRKKNNIREIHLLSNSGGKINWKVLYK